LQKNEIDDEDYDMIANSKIQMVNIIQSNLKSGKDQDEMKKKMVYRAMCLLESSFDFLLSFGF
jgi:hypothetical protein